MSHLRPSVLLLVIIVVATPAVVMARPLSVLRSSPAPEASMDSRNAQYVIRFDGWVDHGLSRMEITQDGKTIEQLVPTGDSEPDVLAASGPGLRPGRYLLHWRAKAVPDNDWSEGVIPFSVAR